MNLYCNDIRTKGAALVEFALLLPIFVLLMLGTIEIGWALYIQNTLVDAARQGARVAVTENVGTGTIVSTVTNILNNANISTASAVVTVTPVAVSLQPRGTFITVTASLPYSSVSILPTPFFLNTATLSSSITMSKEY